MVLELRRISEISKESGIPESTVRRWITRFHHYFNTRKIGKTIYYHPDSIELIKRLKGFYDAGRNAEEIEEILSIAFPKTVTIEAENPPLPEPAPEKKDALLSVIEKSIDNRKEIQILAVQVLMKDEEVKELTARLATVEKKNDEIESLKTEIAILKKTLDFTNANAELLHERVEKIENPPKETTWRAFLRMWKRK